VGSRKSAAKERASVEVGENNVEIGSVDSIRPPFEAAILKLRRQQTLLDSVDRTRAVHSVYKGPLVGSVQPISRGTVRGRGKVGSQVSR
jgi:hypothetical protein